MCSITGGGERLHNVLRQIGSKLWCPWQQRAAVGLYGENGVSTFSPLLLTRSFLYLLVMRTCIKSRGFEFRPLTTELAGLEKEKKNPIDLQWEIGVSVLDRSFLIESSSKLLITRTGIKARSGSIFGRIRLPILELLALE